MTTSDQLFMVKTDQDQLTSRLYQRIVRRCLMDFLDSQGVKYVCLDGELTSRTFNNLILFGCDFKPNTKSVDLAGQFFVKIIQLGETVIRQELNCLEAEDGCLYKITNKAKLLDDLNNLANRGFEPATKLVDLYYQPTTKPRQPASIKRTFCPDNFTDLTINLAIHQPSIVNRIIIGATYDLLTEIVDRALREYGGGTYLESQLADSPKNESIFVKINAKISRFVTDTRLTTAIAGALRDVDLTELEPAIRFYYQHSYYYSQYYTNKYAATGVLTSPAQLRKLVTYDNLVASWSKITLSEIEHWSVNDCYNRPNVTAPKR